MRRILLTVLLLVVSLSAPAADGPLFLWHAEKNDAVIDLFGSVHAGKPAWYPLDARIEKVFAAADTVACEINVADPSVVAKVGGLAMQQGMYPPDESLRDHITAETWEKLLAVEGLSVPEAMLERMRPGLVAMVLAQSLMSNAGLDLQQGIDLHLLNRASDAGRPVVPLETPESQVALIFGPDAVIDGLMLDEALAETPETMIALLEELVAAWQAGDPATMEAVYRQDWIDDARMVRFHEKLLTERNLGMADGLKDRRGHWFVVVGALHLCGEDGVPALLSAAGWTVTQVGLR